jgi:hypothetical protein
MRVVLRDPKNGLFFRNADDWTEHPETARDFLHTATAIFFANEQKLFGMEILLTFGDPEHDFVIART